ncbi:hypothetical protein ES319_A11G171600v1 [Gossypium barbadense]|uniref:Rx N-terminal domain-containing protein n=1 Tax=Gossypium barbadense TaxID=3634 RepID=A0A5J5TST6_GOSBA|nr:hypothetical protein ES319_A11G171600v1 [Gossypium barbadense]
MADAFVSAFVNTILDKLTSLSLEQIGLAGSLKTELDCLESTLSTIQAVLLDAEKKQWKSEAIKNWLGKLKQAAYHLEDVLDDFKEEARNRSLCKDARSKVSTFFSPRNPLVFRLQMARKFKNAREKLNAIAEEKSKFHLREGVGEAEIEQNEDRQTSSLVDESEILGRADEKEEIVSMLLSNASHHDDLSVYAICGMGGLVKTTLAQLAYKDENVAKAFDMRAWVCVSDDFDIKRLTKTIVESIEGKLRDIQELDPLQRHLGEKLVGKRFLLVLDDVWNEYRDKWVRLKQALRSGRRGSTIIVTTRLEKVALMMATDPFQRLGCLSDDDSWSLFKQRAFVMGMNEGNVNLEMIGRQIVQRCGGVPLAITAIGSILGSKSQESEWLRVKDSEIWGLEDEGKRILAVLRLSYEHLPPYMKQCFSFCSIFPKDSVMEKDELIGLWMANGFIPSRGQLDLHDMGCEIFSELTRRSFFQEIKEDVDGTVTCKMHDLIHDVATSIMGHECYAIELNERSKIPKTARHLFVHKISSSTKFMDLSKLQPLRSLIVGRRFDFIDNLSNPSHFFSKQKHLKVLDFGYGFSSIAFGSLKQLRYLRLHDDTMKTLPEATSSLHNLQTLNLQRCYRLEMLPKGMKHLKNLRYLDLGKYTSLASMPVGLGQLSCLRKLSMFVVGKDIGCGAIDELKELALEGELSIRGLHNVKSSTDAKNANLIKKQNLRSLSLSWRVNNRERSQGGNDEEILDVLQPHPSLKKLSLDAYQGDRFPYWMMDLLLPNLVEISLEDCELCDQLPPLGKLRFLKVLTINGMGALKYIDSNFYGDMESSFPSLKVLEIGMAPCLEEWITLNGREQLPLLSSLTIKYCPKLVKMPMLQYLENLEIGGINVTLLKSLIMNATILTSLQINEVDKLTELPDGLLHNQKHLDSLTFVSSTLKSSCDLSDNLSTLKHLSFGWSLGLESLPSGLQNLSSLETLNLSQCDRLVSLPVNGLQGLSSLSSLWIQNCEKLASLSEGVRYLTSLQYLRIRGCPKLTSLPDSFQYLSSLRSLHISYCERLISLPNEIEHLALLSKLEIECCPNLMSLPRGIRGLTVLETLKIVECPHLERRCKEKRGEDWPNINHIPIIKIQKKAWWREHP